MKQRLQTDQEIMLTQEVWRVEKGVEDEKIKEHFDARLKRI